MATIKATLVDLEDGDQLVVLPDAFRFEADEVLVRREGDTIYLEPVKPPADQP
ncbi:MAG TPA: hypothetical protein VGI95_12090 [Caulobacteraceae bacterium]|jgi:virulence-associated protein VagC